MDTLIERANDIRLLVLDVDGVLTDGRLYFSAKGEELKCFHVRDGAGIVHLLRAGIQIAVISGRQSRAVERRMAELGVTWIRQGIDDKLAALARGRAGRRHRASLLLHQHADHREPYPQATTVYLCHQQVQLP